MKTTIILFVVMAISITTTKAQEQPAAVTKAFAKAYPNAKATKWDKENGKYEASFKQNNKEMSVTYNANGSVDETETAISINELPKKAYSYASAIGKIKEASKIVAANGTIQYEAEVKKTDLIFDSQGNFLEEKTSTEDAD